MSVRTALTAAVAAAAALSLPVLGGCAEGAVPPESPFDAPRAAAGVDVDTAALRAQRAAAGIEACPDPGGAPVDGGMPAVSLPCLGGGPVVDLAALRGPLVVNVWAQWCSPCRRELPYFARLHDAGVDVLGVDYEDTQPAAALELAADSGATYPSVADVDGALRAPLRLAGLPTTLFVDGDGTVTAVLAQEFRSYAELVDAVEQQLGVRP